jgi:Cell wall-active antibiotics response 4TMS YvqF
MTTTRETEEITTPRVRRRWYLALDPIFEGGRWGKRAKSWHVEDELVAVAIGGDVTLDLSQAYCCPAHVAIDAYAFFRDVDVIVPEGTEVQLFEDVRTGRLRNDVRGPTEGRCERMVTVHGHCLLGDVRVRSA